MLRGLPLTANIAIFIGAAVVVWLAGTRLARYADRIAEKTGIGEAFLGILLLGGITSLPELAVAVTATLQGTPALTINDVLGSAASNLVILAVADLLIARGALSSIQRSATVMLQGVLGIVLMALAVAATVAGDVLIFGLGAVSWLMLFLYIGAVRLLSKSKAQERWRVTDDPLERDSAEAAPNQGADRPLRRLVMQTIVVGAAILGAGFMLTKSADALAEQTGLGASFFGVVFLAISTSLPEVSTVTEAVRLRRYEMAISDVLGTNLVNVTIIALVDALHPGGPVLLEVGKLASIGALLSLVLTAIYLIGLLERRRTTFLRMGLDSIAVIGTYVCGIVVLYLVNRSSP